MHINIILFSLQNYNFKTNILKRTFFLKKKRKINQAINKKCHYKIKIAKIYIFIFYFILILFIYFFFFLIYIKTCLNNV